MVEVSVLHKVIPLQGTFEYVAVVPDRAGAVFSCYARSQRQLGGDLEHIPRLVGPSPFLQIEDAGPTPNPSVSNAATERSRLRLIAADRRQASVAEASVMLDRGVIRALEPGHLVYIVRTPCGRIAISAIRSNELIFAVGAITSVPLGFEFKALIPTDLIREAAAVFRKRETGFHLPEYPIEVKVSGEQRVVYRAKFALGSFEV